MKQGGKAVTVEWRQRDAEEDTARGDLWRRGGQLGVNRNKGQGRKGAREEAEKTGSHAKRRQIIS